MKKIKLKTRRNLPETNSSSSHSVSICFDDTKDDSPNLMIDSEGYIILPKGDEFGRGLDRYNDALHKALYVTAGFYNSENGVIDYNLKQEFEEVMLSFTGAKGINYEWDPPFIYSDEVDGVKEEEVFYDCPTIDHQSSDLMEEIIESKDIMKDFIFNPKSWLFIADDSGAPKGFYDVSDELRLPVLTLSIELKGSLGRVDFEIYHLHDHYFDSDKQGILKLASNENDMLGGNLYYSLESQEVIYGWNYGRDNKTLICFISGYDILNELGQPLLMFISDDIIKEIITMNYISSEKQFYNNEILTFLKDNYKEGSDWVCFPVSVSSPEFGALWTN